MYSPERYCFSSSVQPPTLRGFRTPAPPAFDDMSAENICSQRSQWGVVPRYPSHTIAKTAA